MITALALAFLRPAVIAFRQPGPNGLIWEEPAYVEAQKNVPHLMIRFSTWDITRFDRSTTYMASTPDMVQQGQFQAHDNEYSFRAIMANELENADKSRLMADMQPGEAEQFKLAYDRSMANFQGSYDPSTGKLVVTYPVKGLMRPFTLYALNQGDDQLRDTTSEAERGMVGLWQAPDPHPQRLDARTRTKIEEEGLPHFASEAAASDGAVFQVMDLRPNGTYRLHANTGTWVVKGSELTLLGNDGTAHHFQISRDGRAILGGGKPAFVRP